MDEKSEHDVRIALGSRAQPVLRISSPTDRKNFPSDSDEEARSEKNILRKLL